MNPISDFMDKAKGLTRNPLGIIALFVSLIYGFACLVLSTSLDNLKGQEERLPLIWFIICFPVLILIGFIYLVVKHHHKLYAPSDYKDETNFVKGLRSYDKGKTFADDFTPPTTTDDAIDTLLNYSSIKGLYALYAIHLANKVGLRFNLSDLESHASLLSEEYTHGFLVAASSLGAFTFGSFEQPFFITSVNAKLSENIKSICYLHAENDKKRSNTTYLFDQLSAIENAFAPAIQN